jgi:hypothetical protein
MHSNENYNDGYRKKTPTALTAKKEQGKKKNYYRIRLTKKI